MTSQMAYFREQTRSARYNYHEHLKWDKTSVLSSGILDCRTTVNPFTRYLQDLRCLSSLSDSWGFPEYRGRGLYLKSKHIRLAKEGEAEGFDCIYCLSGSVNTSVVFDQLEVIVWCWNTKYGFLSVEYSRLLGGFDLFSFRYRRCNLKAVCSDTQPCWWRNVLGASEKITTASNNRISSDPYKIGRTS